MGRPPSSAFVCMEPQKLGRKRNEKHLNAHDDEIFQMVWEKDVLPLSIWILIIDGWFQCPLFLATTMGFSISKNQD